MNLLGRSEPITEAVVSRALKPVTKREANDNARSIIRPFDNAWHIPPTSEPVNWDEFNGIVDANAKGYFETQETLIGSERRFHLLGSVASGAFILPNRMPQTPRDIEKHFRGDRRRDQDRFSVARVRLVSMYPIRPRAEYDTEVFFESKMGQAPKELAARGLALFLNDSSVLYDDKKIDMLADRVATLRQVREEYGRIHYDELVDLSKKSRR